MASTANIQVGFTAEVYIEVDPTTRKIVKARIDDENLVSIEKAFDMNGESITDAAAIQAAHEIVAQDRDTTIDWQFGFDD